jgi:hypothetical protein
MMSRPTKKDNLKPKNADWIHPVTSTFLKVARAGERTRDLLISLYFLILSHYR